MKFVDDIIVATQRPILRRLERIERNQGYIMASVQDVKDSMARVFTEIESRLANVQATIDAAVAADAAGEAVDLDGLKAMADDEFAKITAATAAVVEPPAP